MTKKTKEEKQPIRQQVDIALKLSLWLDATMDEDGIVTRVRAALPLAFGEELTAMLNSVDILDIKQEAEIYATEGKQPDKSTAQPRLLKALITCATLLADYEDTEGEEGDAYREAVAAIAEANGKAA
jgi:hypothetical protein